MTEEQHAAAGKILEDIKTLRSAKCSIENAISVRQRELEKTHGYGGLREWLMKTFATFRMNLDKDKASITVRYEGSRPVEFQIDEQFVNIIMGYLDLRIKQKSQELEAM